MSGSGRPPRVSGSCCGPPGEAPERALALWEQLAGMEGVEEEQWW